MGCSAIKARGIHNGMVREAVKVEDELLGTLELWCRWGRILTIETVEGIHDTRANIWHNM